jgi:hypothetical protein
MAFCRFPFLSGNQRRADLIGEAAYLPAIWQFAAGTVAVRASNQTLTRITLNN